MPKVKVAKKKETGENEWIDKDEADEEASDGIKNYDIISNPNDFNVKTIFDFIKSGVVKLPPFQRYYVWDLRRASRLIESLILGLPIPQIFLFEAERNKFLIIDGQQRLLTIYYFILGKFPKDKMRIELRHLYDEHGNIPEDILRQDTYFDDFNLHLEGISPSETNALNGLSYLTLDKDTRDTFDLRTIRNVILKQGSPNGNDSMYEIFSRLNSGGINLRPQEIRASLYHSKFHEMLNELNLNRQWRKLIGSSQLDIHMKDVEVLLRGFAMLERGEKYTPSMTRFLNDYSATCMGLSQTHIKYRRDLFGSFLDATNEIDPAVFCVTPGRFNITIFEAIFYGVCFGAFAKNQLLQSTLSTNALMQLKHDKTFMDAIQSQTTNTKKVQARLHVAKSLLARG